VTHFTDDLQLLLVLGVGGSVTALAISRVRYGDDWLDPWLLMTKAFGCLALLVIAVGEHEAIQGWWQNAPVSASASLVSSIGLVLTAAIRWKQRQPSIADLLADGNNTAEKMKLWSWPFVLWGAATLSAFLYSVVR
jgi:hypothetical protein